MFRFQFPHWFVYVAWILAVVIILASATFVFLYSVEWGAEKSNEWLLSIFMSFFQSLFVIQPGKVRIRRCVTKIMDDNHHDSKQFYSIVP